MSVIRKGLMDALVDPAIPGLTAYKAIPPNPLYPCVIPIPETSDYVKAFQRGLVVWDYNLVVLVGGVDSAIMQERLDELIDISGLSIPNTLYSNRTLGLSNVDVAVLGVSSYLVRFLNQHIGASLKVRVTTVGTG